LSAGNDDGDEEEEKQARTTVQLLVSVVSNHIDPSILAR
jgi:hypothetical protein